MPGRAELKLVAVRVFDENRRLAVSIARRVRADLHERGLELKRAKVEVAGPGGRRLGDHDMVAQARCRRKPPTQ